MRRTPGARICAAAAVGVVAWQLAGCSSSIKPEGAAQAVVNLVSEQTDFTPDDVTCPDGIEAKVGVTFDCKFTGPDGNYLAHMKIEKIEGEQVLFDINTEVDG